MIQFDYTLPGEGSMAGLGFQTDRTRHLRAGKLDVKEEKAIADIETYGCHIILVKRSAGGPGWAYTVGLHDTCGKGEVVTIGLREEVAHSLLNEAANRQRTGIDLSVGRHLDMVGEVECEFRPVDPKWIPEMMGWAIWYNESPAFPVLQAVYPDRENRFPEDPRFDPYFRQPLLQAGVPLAGLEKTFWDSLNPDSSLFDWKFPDPPDTRVYLSETVQSGTEAVTYVSHDAEDGAWQFLGDSMSGGGGPVVSCLHHPIDADPTLRELADLPLGWYAERTDAKSPWIRRLRTPSDEE